MARSGSGLRRGVAPQFANVPIRADASMPKNVINLESSGQIVGAITNIGEDTGPIDPSPSNVHYLDKFPTPAISLERVSIEDIDRLWDWVRADAEGTAAFLRKEPFTNSRDLFAYIGKIAERERSGLAAFYSIMEDGILLGFIMLDPIMREPGQNPIGTTHIYLQPDARGRLREILPLMLAQADRVAPGMNLCIITSRGEWASMLESVGFTTHIVLTRHSPVTGTAHG